MNKAHFHLLLNHVPIIFPIIGLVILLLGFFYKSDVIKRTSFFVLILGAIITIPAFISGEGAEEIVENIIYDHKLIHEHEEMGEKFAILSYLLGIISLVALWLNWKQKASKEKIAILCIIVCMITIFLGQKTGTTGGEIRHNEIRKDFVAPIEQNEEEDE